MMAPAVVVDNLPQTALMEGRRARTSRQLEARRGAAALSFFKRPAVPGEAALLSLVNVAAIAGSGMLLHRLAAPILAVAAVIGTATYLLGTLATHRIRVVF
ncbi:MAG TPA: hypothetical protein VNF91_11135 [Candidatus Acidoferrum sp.]|nr:hypothetical protein [Candidatus Acidoferrum sp.]